MSICKGELRIFPSPTAQDDALTAYIEWRVGNFSESQCLDGGESCEFFHISESIIIEGRAGNFQSPESVQRRELGIFNQLKGREGVYSRI